MPKTIVWEGLPCTPPCSPSPEVCDNVDNNCNGQIDEGCPTPTPTPNCPCGDCVNGCCYPYYRIPTDDPQSLKKNLGLPPKTGAKIFKGESAQRCSPCNPSLYEVDECFNSGGNYDWTYCYCGASPIVIDVSGDGFSLTNATNGVHFDLKGDGVQEQLGWTSANSDDAWLALDRNGNGLIDDGKELFGNVTDQSAPPQGEQKNGFLALAEFDKISNGGNNDGVITAQDAIFQNLRLWQDTNHNGISEANELKTLNQLGLAKIELNYKESKRTDEHGNRFKYRAKVKDIHGAQIGRWAWDVYLIVQPPND